MLKTLGQANKVRTFEELEYFKEFSAFASKNLQVEENVYRQLLMEQMEVKNGFKDYTVQVGKLKALHYALQNLNNHALEFVGIMRGKIAHLFKKLEAIDIKIVESIHS